MAALLVRRLAAVVLNQDLFSFNLY